MLNPNHGGFSFTTYHDEEGNEVMYQTGVDKYQRPVTKRTHFKGGQRQINIPKNQKDYHGKMAYVDFIRNSPFCEQSKIAGANPTFREIDIEKDAADTNADKKYKFLATSIVFNSTPEELRQLAFVFGYEGENVDLQTQCLLNQAEVNPLALVDASNANDTEVRALLKELISKDIVMVRGSLVEFKAKGTKGNAMLLGVDNDAAVSKLMSDDKVKAMLINQLKIYAKMNEK